MLSVSVSIKSSILFHSLFRLFIQTMASTSNITQAMNNITLDDEEEGGITFDIGEGGVNEGVDNNIDTKLCLVGRFLVDGVIDFVAMKQTLAALWRPGRGVYIREVEPNIYLFQFYHEVDIKRVLEGSPWSFNRKALIISRMQDGDVPRGVSLNNIDLWVQVHDLRVGFMTERVLKEVGNYIGVFVESCSKNFHSIWKEYLRVRVSIDVTRPLKRRMKIRSSGAEWFWINFKYENVPTFCFICGIMGHSEKFCSRLFEVPEAEITKPYGVWMRAPLRRQTQLIASKWLRKDGVEGDWKTANDGGSGRNTVRNNLDPRNQEVVTDGVNHGDSSKDKEVGGQSGILNEEDMIELANKIETGNKGTTVIENKKRRTISGLDQQSNLDLDLHQIVTEEDGMDQDFINNPTMPMDSKNGYMAGSGTGVRPQQ